MANVLSDVLHVACRSQIPPIATATDPPSANYPIMHCFEKIQKQGKISKRKKSSKQQKPKNCQEVGQYY